MTEITPLQQMVAAEAAFHAAMRRIDKRGHNADVDELLTTMRENDITFRNLAEIIEGRLEACRELAEGFAEINAAGEEMENEPNKEVVIRVQDYAENGLFGRSRKASKYSGQSYREDILIPAFENLAANEKLVVDLGSTNREVMMHATAADEVFYYFARKMLAKGRSKEEILSKLEVRPDPDMPEQANKIGGYIKQAIHDFENGEESYEPVTSEGMEGK